MSHKRNGHATTSDERKKHLRSSGKREFWGQHRVAEKTLVRQEVEAYDRQQFKPIPVGTVVDVDA